MDREVVNQQLLEFYANLAILVHDNFNEISYQTARSKKYPYSECLYIYFYEHKKETNAAKYYINNIYYDDAYKFAIDEICNKKKMAKTRK